MFTTLLYYNHGIFLQFFFNDEHMSLFLIKPSHNLCKTNKLTTFERLMERVLAGVLRSCCVVYLDPLLMHAAVLMVAAL